MIVNTEYFMCYVLYVGTRKLEVYSEDHVVILLSMIQG